MRLQGIDFGPVWAASGARGFFGEGYWFHSLYPGLKATLEDTTFVAKTVTLDSNIGNMQLRDDWTPVDPFPDCIKFNLFKGIVLNSVGLSNLGTDAALATGRWQARTEPSMLSFMPIAKTRDAKLQETDRYVGRLAAALPDFKGPIALQVNLSCPNTGENLRELEAEAVDILKILDPLRIPLVPKFNVLTEPRTVLRIAGETRIDGVCVSNTIPYGQIPDKIHWAAMFGEISPLKHLGGGGLSGWPLFQLVRQWVKEAYGLGLGFPINAGGGIMSATDVHPLFDAGADSISIATVIMLRPWRVRSIIRAAQNYR